MTEGCNCLACRAARALSVRVYAFVKGGRKKHRFRCSECELEFEAEEPPQTIPASWVWCPKCGGATDWVEAVD